MPIFELDENKLYFPPAYLADGSGILAIGGDLTPQRLLLAYQKGIFPWFNPAEPILWWSPDPRCVIYPNAIKVSKSMRQVLRKQEFEITFDQAFLEVIYGCKSIYRPGQQGTWISEEMIDAYLELHHQGFIHSVEVWKKGELVGGLYGGNLGKCFFGESMFSKVSNASKVALIYLAKNLQEQNYHFIDCQVHTPHLESLGAVMVPRLQFLDDLKKYGTGIDHRNWNEVFHLNFDF
ncbi:MAG: leucyl/phenylalanyl-tRNA--protein transferase [Flammeovirgaceae bacterium]